MKLYYKDHLHLIENGNIKFSNLIIETLQNVLSLQSSSQLSSACLPQSSLIISPPPPSLPKLNLPSIQTLSQSSSSQSLLATATPFNPRCQNFLLNSPTASKHSFSFSAPPPSSLHHLVTHPASM